MLNLITFFLFFFNQLNDADKTKDSSTSSTTQSIIQRENPHKYLLYKPSFSQFYTYIASAFKDLPPHGVMMVYISADSCEPHSKSHSERKLVRLKKK